MKRALLVMVAVVFLSFTVSSQVMAWTCAGNGYMGDPYGGGYTNADPNANFDTALDTNYQNFLNDTASLREQLAAKQGEYDALMSQPNPDPEYAGQLSLQIAKLHNQIREKAQADGLPARGYGYCNHSCGGYGGGCW
ncbi:MAG: hypothetical protein COX19_11120 [Desulfobacterales bacterium CG23_combo_of_CG06-09_8_20_14_all_51_8]|nr:MAG: hypothetical protein COX19_11120 [Desulfobacterales bacterium CG23_combo_of_CG06-09_8_20_14_all_51_8]